MLATEDIAPLVAIAERQFNVLALDLQAAINRLDDFLFSLGDYTADIVDVRQALAKIQADFYGDSE